MNLQIPKVSFEFFPPKTLQASFNLWESLRILTPLNPDFVSVTYGAGGSTRKLTQEMTETIRHKYQLDVAAHLTCVDASKDETLAVADAYMKAGVTRQMELALCHTPRDFQTPLNWSQRWPMQVLIKFMLVPTPNRIQRPATKMLMLIG
jgi:hypothetical protein